MSAESDTVTGYLVKACNGEYPKGLVHVAWKNSHKKYAKTNIFLASKLGQELKE